MSQASVQISLESRTLADKIAKAEIHDQKGADETKKELWLRMVDNLESDGVPRYQISDRIVKMVTEKMRSRIKDPIMRGKVRFNNSWFFLIMKENRCTAGGKDDDTPDRERGNTSLKNANSEFIEGIQNVKELCDHIILVLKTMKDRNEQPLEIASVLDPEKVKIHLAELRHITKIVKSIVDKKTKIPNVMQHIFIETFRIKTTMISTAKTMTLIQYEMLEKYHAFLTNKQANKFLKGEEPHMLEIFRPKTRDEAIFAGWIGQQCAKCANWRLKTVTDADTSSRYLCIDCGTVSKEFTVFRCPGCKYPLYDADIKKVQKNGKCPACPEKIRLPGGIAS